VTVFHGKRDVNYLQPISHIQMVQDSVYNCSEILNNITNYLINRKWSMENT